MLPSRGPIPLERVSSFINGFCRTNNKNNSKNQPKILWLVVITIKTNIISLSSNWITTRLIKVLKISWLSFAKIKTSIRWLWISRSSRVKNLMWILKFFNNVRARMRVRRANKTRILIALCLENPCTDFSNINLLYLSPQKSMISLPPIYKTIRRVALKIP